MDRVSVSRGLGGDTRTHEGIAAVAVLFIYEHGIAVKRSERSSEHTLGHWGHWGHWDLSHSSWSELA